MRVIKFRAWDKTNKRMLDRVLAGPGDPCSIVWLEDRKDWVQFDEFCGEIMQYTGLQDAKGQDIYEGDILQETFMGEVLEWSRWRVGYEHGAFGVYRPPSAGEEEPSFQTFFDGFQDLDRFSIIGNIYENHELLDS